MAKKALESMLSRTDQVSSMDCELSPCADHAAIVIWQQWDRCPTLFQMEQARFKVANSSAFQRHFGSFGEMRAFSDFEPVANFINALHQG
jgi:hypothetical protein